jgi:putative ABC transport system ATP-binding protein
MSEAGQPIIAVEGLRLTRGEGASAFTLSVPSFAVEPGSRVALVGASGCGKSTLLDALALVLLPNQLDHMWLTTRGVRVDVRRTIAGRRHGQLALLRRSFYGYVLQTGGLLPFLTVGDNIALPCRLLRRSHRERLGHLARHLGIERHLRKYPSQLSVGERQRVAIARALIHQPPLVLADEPTAALDPDSSDRVMGLLVELAEADGITVIVASHDHQRVDRFGFRRVTPSLSRGEDGITSTFEAPWTA